MVMAMGNTKDQSKTVVILYGGVSGTGLYLDDIWQYDTLPATGGFAWSQIRPLSMSKTYCRHHTVTCGASHRSSRPPAH